MSYTQWQLRKGLFRFVGPIHQAVQVILEPRAPYTHPLYKCMDTNFYMCVYTFLIHKSYR